MFFKPCLIWFCSFVGLFSPFEAHWVNHDMRLIWIWGLWPSFVNFLGIFSLCFDVFEDALNHFLNGTLRTTKCLIFCTKWFSLKKKRLFWALFCFFSFLCKSDWKILVLFPFLLNFNHLSMANLIAKGQVSYHGLWYYHQL